MQSQQASQFVLEPEIKNIRYVIKPISQSFNFKMESMTIVSGRIPKPASTLMDELVAWDQLSDDALLDFEVALQ